MNSLLIIHVPMHTPLVTRKMCKITHPKAKNRRPYIPIHNHIIFFFTLAIQLFTL